MDNKKKANLNAARYLNGSSSGIHCNASIHCSYYAVLQYMKFLLNSLRINPIPYDKQNPSGEGNSHDFLFGEIWKRFDGTPIEQRKYKELFKSLKQHRVTSDYKLETFSLEECLNCESMANGIISLLANRFRSKIA